MKEKKHFYFSLGLFLTSAFLIYPLFKYGINPDAIAYISIAKKYFLMKWDIAINGNWGPLLSFLYIPSLLLGVEPIFYAKFFNIFLSILLFIQVKKLAISLSLPENYRITLFYSLIVPALYFTYWVISPDFILLILFLIYVYHTISEEFLETPGNAILVSASGGLMFLAKSYGFPFFILHFMVFSIIKFLGIKKEKRKSMLLNWSLAVLIFGIISGSWILALNYKYDIWHFSSGNKAFFSQIDPKNEMKHQYLSRGIVEPPDSLAGSAHDDPSHYKLVEWSPFQTREDFVYYIGWVANNIFRLIIRFLSFTPLILLLLIPGVFAKWVRDKKVILLILSMLLYLSGYMLVFVEMRYLWQVFVPGMILAAKGVFFLFEKFTRIKKFENIALLFLILSFLPVSFSALAMRVNSGEKEFVIAQNIKAEFSPQDRIASDTNWLETYYISYFAGFRYLGEEDKNLSDSTFIEKLRTHNVAYIFQWRNKADGGLEEVAKNTKKEFRIYKLRDEQ